MVVDAEHGRVVIVRAPMAPMAMLALGVAFAASVWVGVCVAGCALLSILYSHPRTAWKGHAALGPLTNALGYGVLSPIGGFSLTGFAPTIRGGLVVLVALPWMLSAYFAAQAFQQEDDRARGYRTLVATHGPIVTLRLTRALFWVGLLATIALAATGVLPRLALVPMPLFFFVDRHLVRWMAAPGGGDASWAGRFFARLALITALVVAFVSLDYEISMRTRSLPGGLTTASGLFEVRACEGQWPAFVRETRSR